MKTQEKFEKYINNSLFVFHGSPKVIDQLVLKQATTIDPQTNQRMNDGEPAVAATKYLDIAIFRALINNTNCPDKHRSGFGLDNGKLFFKATKECLEFVRENNAIGYVYILDAKKFLPYSPKEVRAYLEIRPIKVVKVTPEDLPEGIEFIKY